MTNETLPSNYFLENSTMTWGFSKMMFLPAGCYWIRTTATTSWTHYLDVHQRWKTRPPMLITHDGVWLGCNKPRPMPHPTPHPHHHPPFQQLEDIHHTNYGQLPPVPKTLPPPPSGESPDLLDQFVYDASINKCRETMREHAATKMTREFTLERMALAHVYQNSTICYSKKHRWH